MIRPMIRSQHNNQFIIKVQTENLLPIIRRAEATLTPSAPSHGTQMPVSMPRTLSLIRMQPQRSKPDWTFWRSSWNWSDWGGNSLPSRYSRWPVWLSRLRKKALKMSKRIIRSATSERRESSLPTWTSPISQYSITVSFRFSEIHIFTLLISQNGSNVFLTLQTYFI